MIGEIFPDPTETFTHAPLWLRACPPAMKIISPVTLYDTRAEFQTVCHV